MRASSVSIAAALVIASGTAVSANCPDGTRRAEKARTGCAAPKKFEPYDPGRVRAGSSSGFVDAGGGTQVRIGGRTRVEYQYTR